MLQPPAWERRGLEPGASLQGCRACAEPHARAADITWASKDAAWAESPTVGRLCQRGPAAGGQWRLLPWPDEPAVRYGRRSSVFEQSPAHELGSALSQGGAGPQAPPRQHCPAQPHPVQAAGHRPQAALLAAVFLHTTLGCSRAKEAAGATFNRMQPPGRSHLPGSPRGQEPQAGWPC